MITHQLSVQIAKNLFIDSKGCVLRMLENTKLEDAKLAKLDPLLIYNLNIEGVAARFQMFSSIKEPLSVVDFLLKAWDKKSVHGKPTTLKVSQLTAEYFPWLDEFCILNELLLIVADGKDKSFTGNQRASQTEAVSHYYHKYEEIQRNGEHLLPKIADLNTNRILMPDGWSFPIYGMDSWSKVSAGMEYSALTKTYISWPMRMMAWDQVPLEQFLLINQKSIPNRNIALIQRDIDYFYGKIDSEEFGIITDEIESDAENDFVFDGNEIVNKLLKCWPQSKGQICKYLKIKSQEFEWYLTGKKGLHYSIVANILSIFSIEQSLHYTYEDGRPFYECYGSYLLKAPNKAHPLEMIFGELRLDGDDDFNVEITPDSAQCDPSFRIMIIGKIPRYHIIVFNRSSLSTNLLKDSILTPVPIQMYLDTLKLFADSSDIVNGCNDINEKFLEWQQEVGKFWKMRY